MEEFTVRQMTLDDVDGTTKMEVEAWHEYYSQYEDLYDMIKDSVNFDGNKADWTEFLKSHEYDGKMVTGDDRVAYIALDDNKPVGVAAVSSYSFGLDQWKPVDAYFKEHGVDKVAKFQNLYVSSAQRGRGIGRKLNVARIKHMLDLGYRGLFLAPFAGAEKTMRYHTKNGLTHVHTYPSLTLYKGKPVDIACFVHPNMEDLL